MAQGVAALQNNGKRRFAAFISYAHADGAIAATLQSKLERYRLPKHIAAIHGGGSAALGQIFRDREDLAAAPSLSEAIRAAIAEAEALIVICSPDARASRWVGEEIALFRALHPDRPVLAAIVRGELGTAFPAALTEGGTEPLAADLRKEADGEALGFLKIVAGIAGVPLDALVQRDAQRRIRRVMWITGAAISAMLVMGIMTTLALSARNEAARQRAEAEGLVEYMLTDLREKLKGVGRLDVMGAVNERAMAYYGGGSVEGQLLKARTLHAQGEDFEKLGELNKAEPKFVDAFRSTGALYRSNPTNKDVVFAHAQSVYWIGRVAELRGDWKRAKQQFRQYRQLARQLAKIGNAKIAFLELGHSETNLGIVAFTGEKANRLARQHFANAQNAYDAAAGLGVETDEQIYYRSNTAAWLADTFYAEQDFNQSLTQRRLELSLNARVAGNKPDNAEAAFRVAKSEFALGKNLLKIENAAEAEKILRDAKQSLSLLIALDRTNTEWAFMQFRTVCNLAIAAFENGSRQRAMIELEEATGIGVRLAKVDRTLPEQIEQALSATRSAIGVRNAR